MLTPQAAEDQSGQLVGLLSHRAILRVLAERGKDGSYPAVKDVMKTDLVTVSPDTTTLAAIELMREKRVGSLLVVEDGHLVGIVTEHDFIEVAARLFEESLRDGELAR